jgi:hypothetical protein
VRLRGGGGGVLACGFNRNGRCGVPEDDPNPNPNPKPNPNPNPNPNPKP